MATHAPSRVTRALRAELLHGVYAIVDDGARTHDLAQAILIAGVRVLQYRAKSGVRGELVRRLREMTAASDALLILNDDWRAAVAFDCDGVHLGPDDDGYARPASLRDILPDRLIGLSCGTAHEVRRAGDADVDYVGIGSVFATLSKPDAGAPIGVGGLRRLACGTNLPVAAIGGITAGNLSEIRASGVAMAAVISAISAAPQPGRAAAQLIACWNAAG
jgi:thiamine-phosphate pyrophosphorylase